MLLNARPLHVVECDKIACVVNPTKDLSNKSLILTPNNYTYFGSMIYICDNQLNCIDICIINPLNWVHGTFWYM